MSNLTTVLLHGELGEKFGKEFQFQVASPLEALRLLGANFKEFNNFFVGNGTKRYQIFLDKNILGMEELNYPSSSKEVIRIVPVVEGGTDNPVANILIGAAIAYALPALAPTFFATGTTALAVASNIGWALILGGVSAILFSPPKIDGPEEKDKNKPSYNFDGPVNTIRQGNPIPIGYGQLRVGSQVVSVGTSSKRILR